MGYGVGAIGQGLGGVMQGYLQGKAMARQQRFQQAEDIAGQADRLTKHIDQMAPTDPNRQLLMDQWSQLMDNHDKLIAEKGPGAWKTVKQLVGLGGPKPGGDSSSPLASAGAPGAASSSPMPAASPAGDQPASSDWDNSPGGHVYTPPADQSAVTGGSPLVAGSPAGPAMPSANPYKTTAYNSQDDPNVPGSLASRKMHTDNVIKGVGAVLRSNNITSWDEAKANPQVWNSLMDAQLAAIKGETVGGVPGLGSTVSNTLNSMLGAHDSTMKFSGDNEYGKMLGLGPGQTFNGPPQLMADLVARNTPLVKMQNRHAELTQTIANLRASGQPVPSAMSKEFDSIDSVMHPEKANIDNAFMNGIDPTDSSAVLKAMKAAENFKSELRKKEGMANETYQHYAGSDGYMYQLPNKGGEATRVKVGGKDLYVGDKGRQGAEWFERKDKDGVTQIYPNVNVIKKNLQAGLTDPEEVEGWLRGEGGLRPTIPNPMKSPSSVSSFNANIPDTIPNPDYSFLRGMLTDYYRSKGKVPTNPTGGAGSLGPSPFPTSSAPASQSVPRPQ